MTTDRPGFDGRHWLVIALITVLAAGLRFACLGEWSLWVDEAHTWRDATMALDGEFGFLSSDRALYPVTFVLLRGLFGVGVLGFDEASLRLPFAILGVVTIPVMAVCGRRLIGAWPSVLAAAFLAVSPWHVFWSQNARGYVFVVFVAVVVVHQVHVWLATEGPRYLIAAMVLTVFGSICHPTAALLAVGFVGFLVARRVLRGGATKTRVRRLVFFSVLAVAVLGALPWLIRTYAPFVGFLKSKGNPSVVHYVETVAYYFRPTILLLALLGLLAAPRAVGRDRSLLLGAMLLVPFLVLLIVGGQVAKVTARYAICTLPVAFWLVAMLCGHVAERLREQATLTRGMCRALAWLLPVLVLTEFARLDVAYFTSQHGQRSRWREASAFVRGQAKLRGLKGVNALTVSHPTLLYYLRQRHWFVTAEEPYPNTFVQPIQDWMIAGGVNAAEQKIHEPGVDEYLAYHQRLAEKNDSMLAVMVNLPKLREKDRDGELWSRIQRDFELALHLPCWVGPKDLSVYVYLPKVRE